MSVFKIKPEHKKYIRLVAGIIILILGAVFMIVPFIPLGYIFLFAGLFLLSFYIPAFKKPIDKLRKKDKKNRFDKVEDKIDKTEEKIDKKIVEDDDENQNKNQ